MPLQKSIQNFLLEHPWLGWSSGALLAFVGSLITLAIARELHFPEDHGHLPPLLYLLLIALFPSSLWAHPSAFAVLFMIIACWRLVRVQKAISPTPFLFDAGLALGVGGLFHFPSLFFLPFLWMAAFNLRALSWRDFLWPIIGAALPYLFQAAYLYLTDHPELFPLTLSMTGPVQLPFTENSQLLSRILWGLIGLFFLVGVFASLGELQRSNMQGKRLRGIFFLLLFFSLAIALFASFYLGDPYAWTLLAFPFSFLFTPFLARKRYGTISSFVFYLWLLVMLLNYYMSSYF